MVPWNSSEVRVHARRRPLIATIVGGRATKFIALAAMLYIPGGLITLLGNQLMPAPILPLHALEILADSIVYGFAFPVFWQARVT